MLAQYKGQNVLNNKEEYNAGIILQLINYPETNNKPSKDDENNNKSKRKRTEKILTNARYAKRKRTEYTLEE